MNIRAIKTAQSESAVNRIKMITKKEIKDFEYNIPKIFLDKKQYMQSDEFIKDAHNAKMLEMGDELYNCRTQIAQEIVELNKHMKEKFVQAINGFTRLKSDIDKNNKLNFEEIPTIDNKIENDYRLLRNIAMFAESKKAFF